MELDVEKLVKDALNSAIYKGLEEKLSARYGKGVFDDLYASVLKQQESTLRAILTEAVSVPLSDAEFRKQIIAGIRQKMATMLVQRFGGEMEKAVNALKSDPATRSRIVLALEQIVAEKPA
jgi:hypothetical protein